jgi:hypothetical protein
MERIEAEPFGHPGDNGIVRMPGRRLLDDPVQGDSPLNLRHESHSESSDQPNHHDELGCSPADRQAATTVERFDSRHTRK